MILSWSHAAILRSALDRLILRIPDIDYRLVDEKKFLVDDILLLQTSFPSWLWQISGPAPGCEVGDVSIAPRAMVTDPKMSPVQVLGFYNSATTASSMFHSAIVCARRSCALALWFKFVCSVRPARAIMCMASSGPLICVAWAVSSVVVVAAKRSFFPGLC